MNPKSLTCFFGDYTKPQTSLSQTDHRLHGDRFLGLQIPQSFSA